MSFFGKKKPTPAEIVKAVKESVTALEKGEKKSSEKVKVLLFRITPSVPFLSVLNTLRAFL